ncbi:hypothetical protein C7974DRAFT_15389 [Boeremia exigua]|uniref:uncharacterized protein n=1 Tax=Boeremia exigua TaxID=749465 RepID=UPI001E8D964F|nr:uncharacterized protein C7974DRAFT_15389 [Boeremia exigua]KAH6644143.1 hypothetical protein C7974DRAFT_15389 [Boeremia exigua]
MLDPRALHDGTKQVSTFAVAIPFILVTTLVMILRLHVRLRLLQGGLGIDDCLLLIGYIFTIALSIATMICGWYGVGTHCRQTNSDRSEILTMNTVRDIPTENMTPLLKSNYSTRLLYTIALGFVKSSILVFYMRLDHRKFTRLAVWFLLAFVVALSITTFFFLAFVCVPPSLFWDLVGQAAAPEKCLDQSTQQMFFNLNGICNIIQDISIYLLPIPMLWNLQMPLRQKLALGALFSVGLIAVAASCVRFYYVLFLANEADIWYYMADSLNWCNIEIYAAIICSSASTFKALLKTYLPRFWGSSQRSAPEDADHSYDRSDNGRFSMKPHGTSSSTKSHSNRKYGVTDLTNIENESEEAIVTNANAQVRVSRRK